ncbi:M1 family metallopeptidase [Streptomyces sp. KR80]|uniref:M1 family metallopeptidase n=1 Tax=Streptomyces sp. KR80 TaxID=3457426 RepID=UPI003FCFF334
MIRRPFRRAALAAAAMATFVAAGAPSPVPLGVGDRLFPYLGNPGYDVLAYDIAFAYSGSNSKPLEAVTAIDARATARLKAFNLDFARGRVRSVRVNGKPARFQTVREDLAVTPAEPVPHGAPLRITVAHTSAPDSQGNGGWVRTQDGLAMANQADAGHRVFPCNDHPSDKARFTFRVTAPKNLTVVASGLPLSREKRGRTTTWAYRTAHPMATELAQLSIGRSAVLRRSGPRGLPIRDVVPAADRKRLAKWLAKTPGHISWMERHVGRFPFETYGVLIADARTGFELETQTLSLFERRLLTDPRFPEWAVESIMVHELAHQWFGNSVSPATWSDLWLNEGHATWYEGLYMAKAAKSARSPLAAKVTLDERMRQAYARSDSWRAAGGPPAALKVPEPGKKTGIFRPVVYDGSALVLYALRQRIGAPAFERLERAWVTKHRDGNASTADFIALASKVSGRDQTAFLRSWLYDTKTPPMPGHPDWKADKAAPGSGGGKGAGEGSGRAPRPPHAATMLMTGHGPGKPA